MARTAGGPGPAKRALLERCVRHLQEVGFSDLSMRELAAAVGTSHRMLLYHFGSRNGLLVEIVNLIEAHQRAVLAELEAETDDLAELSRAFWKRVSDPALAPAERLFFEIYAHALNGRPWAASFRESVITAWTDPVAQMLAGRGVPPREAARRARLSLAVGRGLLLDLLATGDQAAVDDAADLFTELITREGGQTAGGGR
ncbi:TetR family transcriptional regulator [Sphaerisporangium krabiense]|uniref:AcrR family transcriptional regulator n=1 Tax=Sphaerisporangium krabiense TaxID=763782 RepID=A0A7W9DUI2_9ACTN|nr:helix-turn-helix domain-containing protein [Sphaerisporangium krabiense]MBB5630460.1 AcrR family transcriptional regulator [Sphaerisporangium krabiense]GII62588.1 TetR family transcriptional regulator [Sphaerisporangium krabiense]